MASWLRASFGILAVLLVMVGSTLVPTGSAEAANPVARDDGYVVTGGGSLTIPAQHGFDTEWGTTGTGDGQFTDPRRLAVDALGYTYVTDSAANRVQKFAPDGAYVTQWGTSGTGDGQLSYPFGIAVDASGYVYVVESWNHRVQKFTSDGAFVTKWGVSGSADGELNYPEGIAIDNHGYVYVIDTANSRVQKFSSSGNFVTKWGTIGTGDGQFQHPYGIATDSERNVYVTDRDNHRVQKFTSTGVFADAWGSEGTADGQFTYPDDIAVDQSDSVFVIDGSNLRVQQFATDGTFLLSWGEAGSGDGQFTHPQGITTDTEGRVYVTDLAEDRVQRFTPAGLLANDSDADEDPITAVVAENPLHGELVMQSDGAFTYTPDLGFHGVDSFDYTALAGGSAWDAEVTITVLEGPNNAPLVLDDAYRIGRDEVLDVPAFHEFDMKWLSCAPSNGSTTAVTGLAVDESDNVFVAGLEGEIHKYTSEGELLVAWGSPGSTDGEFDYPHQFAFGTTGDVFITEHGNDRVQRFTEDGAFAGGWGGSGSADGQFDGATGIAFDSNGVVYVADSRGARIQQFTSSGQFLGQWEGAPSGPGGLSGPWGLAIDSEDNLYVANNSGRMQKWTTDGVLITEWGEYGHGPGQSTAWSSIDIDGHGVLYANDFENARIQKFTTDGRYIGEWGEWGTADSQFNSASGVAVDSHGRVYVGEFRLCTVKRFTPAGVLGNDIEPEDGTMGASVVTGPSHGLLTLDTDGSFVYTPDTGWIGTDTFVYAASDGALTSNANVQIVVAARGRFIDDDDSIFENNIEWLADNGITYGCNPPVNDEFCPTETVTRGQMAAFLVRALGLTDSGSGDPFSDDDGSIFEADIAKLAVAGITKGCNPPANTMFCPRDPVTRGQMAAFLVRAMGYTADDGDLFVDDDGSVFEASINILATAGVTRGCNPPENDRFCPHSNVTRGQMAAFLHRALGE